MNKVIAGIAIGMVAIGIIGCGNEIVEQPTIQSGNQAVFSCESGIIYMNGIAQGKTVTIKWNSPIIGGRDMTQTLFCMNGSPKVGAYGSKPAN